MAHLHWFMFIIIAILSLEAPVFASDSREDLRSTSCSSASQAASIVLDDTREEISSAAYAAASTQEIKGVELRDELTSLRLSLSHNIEDDLSMFANEPLESVPSQSICIVQKNQNEPAHIATVSKEIENLQENYLMGLPYELKWYLAEKLSIEDICRLIYVSREGRKSFDHSYVWYKPSQRFRYDTKLPGLKAAKEEVIRYYLRMKVNLMEDPRMIKPFMRKHKKYMLNKDLPFESWRYFLMLSRLGNNRLISTWAAQEYGMAWAMKCLNFLSHDLNIMIDRSLYDHWAQPGEEVDIVRILYRFCYAFLEDSVLKRKDSRKLEKEIGKKVESLSDEFLIRIKGYISNFSKEIFYDIPPQIYNIMVRRPDFSLRFEVLDRIKAKVLSIVKERVEFQDGSGIDPIQKLIENAVAQNEPWGYFLQALGLKYGILGYPQNIVKARKFIRDNYISY